MNKLRSLQEISILRFSGFSSSALIDDIPMRQPTHLQNLNKESVKIKRETLNQTKNLRIENVFFFLKKRKSHIKNLDSYLLKEYEGHHEYYSGRHSETQRARL